jgi:hypothetical protein
MARTITGTNTTGITLTSQSDNPVTVASTAVVSKPTGALGALYGKGGATNTWTIDNFGVISGGFGSTNASGVYLGGFLSAVTSGVLINETAGTVLGNTYAVFINGPASITNKSGGTISARTNAAVYLRGLSTVVNSGVITDSTNTGVYLEGGGSLTNNAGGSINAASIGARLVGVGTVNNAGTISGPSFSVLFGTTSTSNRLIANPGATFAGRIGGGTGVLELAAGNGSAASLGTFGSGGITNFSTLQFDPGANWTVVGNTSASGLGTIAITGFTSNDTIDLTGFAATSDTFANNALTLTNASKGTATLHIQGAFSSSNFALSSDGKGGTNIALKSGIQNPIAGTYTSGITLSSTLGSPVSVTGLIDVSSSTALYGPGGYSWTVDNSGVVAGGTAGSGIQLGGLQYVDSGVVTNRSSGTITGGIAGVLVDTSGTAAVANAGGMIQGGAFGVAISGSGTVTNAAGGQILDAGTTGTTGAAIYVYSGQVYNAGSLTGRYGVKEFLGGSVTNVSGGTIVGTTSNGIDLASPGTVVNDGMVGGSSVGVFLEEGGSVTNHASGIISGSYGVINYGFNGGGGDVTNAGTIIGTAGYAVQFKTEGGSNYRLTVDPGAVFIGAVDGGGGMVELASGSSAGTLYGFGGTITNFSTLQFDPGASWRISGDQIGLGAMTISGFSSGDLIDLTDFAATGESFGGGALTLTNGGGTAYLQFPDVTNLSDFAFAPDGTGGTDIAGAGTGQTLSWATPGGGDWNTPANWSPALLPTGFDTAVIANPGSNSVTIAAGVTNIVGNLLLNAADDALQIDGSLDVLGAVTIDAGSLIAVGSLTTPAITDNGLLATQFSQTLDNTPVGLGGTVQVQASGELILGPNEVVTQTGPTAILDSTTSGGESIVNQGTIDASHPGGSLRIVPLNFTNQGTVNVDNETATIGYDQAGTLGAWDNSAGTIALSGSASLVLDGSVATSGIGAITGAAGVTEAGLLDNTFGTLTIGAGTPLGTVTLASSGTISGGTVADDGGGILFSGGTLGDVTYLGPLELRDAGERATIAGSLTVEDAGGSSPGTIDLTGSGTSLLFVSATTLDSVVLDIGNAQTAATLQAASPDTFGIGPAVTIDSSAAGALAILNAGTGAGLNFAGTLNAAAAGGTFTLADGGGTFSNDGSINVANADTLEVNTAIAAGSGTIAVGGKGLVNVAAVTVGATQMLDFPDAAGVLRISQPSSFLATITNFRTGDAIDLATVKADAATWAGGTLTVKSGGTAVATLSLQGDYAAAPFAVASDGGTGSIVTVTATCYAAGTRIATPRGEVPIERLHRDDLVQTISGKPQPICWIGHRRVDFRRHPNRQRVLPVRIAANAFGPGRPKRNLVLSPDHAVFVEGVLIPIRHLINGANVTRLERHAITYYHVELPRHDVLLADGMPAESYLEAGARRAFANGEMVVQLHPDFTPPQDHYAMLWEQYGYAPLVVAGEAVERVRDLLSRNRYAA